LGPSRVRQTDLQRSGDLRRKKPDVPVTGGVNITLATPSKRCKIAYACLWRPWFSETSMLSLLGRGIRLCDGISRREVLRVGGLGFTGLAWSDWLRARAEASPAD